LLQARLTGPNKSHPPQTDVNMTEAVSVPVSVQQILLDDVVDAKADGMEAVDEKEDVEVLTAPRGLSKLCESCFGKPLCKDQQMSNWRRRPLRPEQVEYAALDAVVLIAIYMYCDVHHGVDWSFFERNLGRAILDASPDSSSSSTG